MSIVVKYEPLIKGQAEYHRRAANRAASGNNPNIKSQIFHQNRLRQWESFVEDLAGEQENINKPSSISPKNYGLRPQDIEGLPKELLDELNLQDGDLLEFAITKVIDAAGGTLSLPRILVDLYRSEGRIEKRDQLGKKLYRMVRKGVIAPVPKRKAVYTTDVPDDAVVEDDDQEVDPLS